MPSPPRAPPRQPRSSARAPLWCVPGPRRASRFSSSLGLLRRRRSPGAASPSARATPRPPRASPRLSRVSPRLSRVSPRLSRPPPRGALCSRPSPSSAGASFQFGSRPGGRTRARRRASRLAFARARVPPSPRRVRARPPRAPQRPRAVSNAESRYLHGASPRRPRRRGGGRAPRSRPTPAPTAPPRARARRTRTSPPTRASRTPRPTRTSPRRLPSRNDSSRRPRGARPPTPQRAPRGRFARRGTKTRRTPLRSPPPPPPPPRTRRPRPARRPRARGTSRADAASKPRRDPRREPRRRGCPLRSPPGPRESPRRARRAPRPPRVRLRCGSLRRSSSRPSSRHLCLRRSPSTRRLVLRGGARCAYHHRRRGREVRPKRPYWRPAAERRFPSGRARRRGAAVVPGGAARARSAATRGAVDCTRSRCARPCVSPGSSAPAFARERTPHYGLCPACRARRRRGARQPPRLRA